MKTQNIQTQQENMKTFNIRKKIAKHGINTIIVIPKLLQQDLPRGTVVDIEIKIIEKPHTEDEFNEDKENVVGGDE